MRRSFLIPLIAAAALTTTGLAQPEAARGRPPGQPPPSSTELSLEFRGGSMESFVEALHDSTKDPVNIVLQGVASKIHVDAMKLRNVTVASAVRAALEPRIGVTEIGRDGVASTIMLTTVRPDDQGQPVFIVGVRTDQAAPGRHAGGPVTEVLSIQRLLQGSDGAPPVSERVVLSAIDSGLKLTHAEGDSQPEISYHKDSGLLLVRGNVGDVQVVRSVVGQMSEDHKRRGIEATQRKKNAIHYEAEMRKAQVKLGLAERRREMSERRLGEVQELVKSGNTSQADLTAAVMSVEEAKAQVELLRIEIAQIAQEMDLRATEDAPPPEEKPETPAGGKAKTKGK